MTRLEQDYPDVKEPEIPFMCEPPMFWKKAICGKGILEQREDGRFVPKDEYVYFADGTRTLLADYDGYREQLVSNCNRQLLIDLLKDWANVQRLYVKAKVNTDSAILYETARTEHALCMLRLCKRYGVEV
jgi:hypothetical protein